MRRYYSGMNVARALDIEELRRMALRRLPAFVAEYLEGGAEDEVSLRQNRERFQSITLLPRALVDVSQRDLRTRLLDQPCGLPIVVGPTGFNGLLWRHADIALARAAAAKEIPFAVSTVSSDSLEAIAQAVPNARLWFQLYVLRDEAAVESLIARAEQAGCEALIVTVDAPVYGNRTWDARNYAAPLKLTLRSKLDVLRRLRWLFGVFLPRGLPGFGNLEDLLPEGQQSPLDGARYMGTQINAALDWTQVKKLRDRWPRKLLIKGILSPEDAELAAGAGADGIILSNHGGRQLDCSVSPLQILPAVVASVGDRLTVMLDGGFRRGSDVFKALALGAKAVLLGRATLYGVAAGGERGALQALEIMTKELDRVLALMGCPTVQGIGARSLYATSTERGVGGAFPAPRVSVSS